MTSTLIVGTGITALALANVLRNAGKSIRRIGSGFGHESEDAELTSPRCA